MTKHAPKETANSENVETEGRVFGMVVGRPGMQLHGLLWSSVLELVDQGLMYQPGRNRVQTMRRLPKAVPEAGMRVLHNARLGHDHRVSRHAHAH